MAFYYETCPWYGVMWERLVGTTRRSLTLILGRSKPTLGAFRALVAESELILNDRQLVDPFNEIIETDALRRINVIPYDKEVAEEILDLSYRVFPTQLLRSLINSTKP